MKTVETEYYPIGNWIEKLVSTVVKTPCDACKKRRDKLNRLVKKGPKQQ
jgi:hypothetical protein